MTRLINLSPAARRLYAGAVQHDGVDPQALASACGLTGTTAASAVTELQELGLLVDAGKQGAVRAVSPSTVAMLRLLPAERRLAAEQRELAQVRELLDEMGQQYDTARGDLEVLELPSDEIAAQVLDELADAARSQVLSCHPGGSRSEAELFQAGRRVERALRRGVKLRMLYQHAARYDLATMSHVRDISRSGGSARMIAGELTRMIVFDDQALLLPRQDRRPGLLLIREPSIIEFATWVFEQLWRSANPAPSRPVDPARNRTNTDGPTRLGGLKRPIVQLLAEGHSDKSIARRLGISERTCQRHLAQLFEEIGARSRCHAGVLIERLGLLGSEPTTIAAVQAPPDRVQPSNL